MSSIKQQYELKAVTPFISKKQLPSKYKIASKELIGIEVEVEGVENLGPIEAMWQVKEDSSLRNNGREFVSRPILACDAPGAIESLMTQTLSASCCFSPRTSVHIHLNYQDDTAEDVTNLLLVYAVFERLLFQFVGKQRIKNIYCVPITETDLLLSINNTGPRPQSWQKYAALNIKPLAEYGTVEFRHMHGTFDSTKLCIWIDMLVRMKEYCKTQGTKQIRALMAGLNDKTDFNNLIKEVFGELSEYLPITDPNDVLFTYPIAKHGMVKNSVVVRLGQEAITTSPFFQLAA